MPCMAPFQSVEARCCYCHAAAPPAAARGCRSLPGWGQAKMAHQTLSRHCCHSRRGLPTPSAALGSQPLELRLCPQSSGWLGDNLKRANGPFKCRSMHKGTCKAAAAQVLLPSWESQSMLRGCTSEVRSCSFGNAQREHINTTHESRLPAQRMALHAVATCASSLRSPNPRRVPWGTCASIKMCNVMRSMLRALLLALALLVSVTWCGTHKAAAMLLICSSTAAAGVRRMSQIYRLAIQGCNLPLQVPSASSHFGVETWRCAEQLAFFNANNKHCNILHKHRTMVQHENSASVANSLRAGRRLPIGAQTAMNRCSASALQHRSRRINQISNRVGAQCRQARYVWSHAATWHVHAGVLRAAWDGGPQGRP
jgi:hypothetical protein